MKRDLIGISELSLDEDIIDVRSPSEYRLDHIPGSINLPVLDDDERKLIGWTYKNESSFKAKRIGASLVSKNIAKHLEGELSTKTENWAPIIYCWRGGKRSGSMALVFRQIGWRARQLSGGYKSFRRQVIEETSDLASGLSYVVVCGLTGTAKTDLIAMLTNKGEQTLDLEALAKHRGSLLGFHSESAQPSQKRFETELWNKLRSYDPSKPVFLESESKKIGDLRVPEALINAYRQGECINVQASLETRTAYLKENYIHLIETPPLLITQIEKLVSRHGNKIVNHWLSLIKNNAWDEFVHDLLKTHYDVSYSKSMHKNFKNFSKARNYPLTDLSEGSVLEIAEEVCMTYGNP